MQVGREKEKGIKISARPGLWLTSDFRLGQNEPVNFKYLILMLAGLIVLRLAWLILA